MKHEIRALEVNDLPDAIKLIETVFMAFEAPDYDVEGVEEFMSFIQLKSLAEKITCGKLRAWGCYDNHRLIGVIAMRLPSHIALLFVDADYHRQGIARALFNAAKNDYPTTITVNSSPYAETVYEKLGFTKISDVQKINGMLFIPMTYN